jgi:hypothetical protein
VLIKNVAWKEFELLKLIIKNIVLTSVVALQLIGGLWKSIMRKRLLEMVLFVDVKNVTLRLSRYNETTFMCFLPEEDRYN